MTNASETDSRAESIEHFAISYFQEHEKWELQARQYDLQWEEGLLSEKEYDALLKKSKAALYRKFAAFGIAKPVSNWIDLLRHEYPQTFTVLSIKVKSDEYLVEVEAKDERQVKEFRLHIIINANGKFKIKAKEHKFGRQWLKDEL